MGSQRAHIVLPQSLLRDIDALVGPCGRSAFFAETAQAEIRHRQLLRFLESDEAVWHEEDHPELADGSAAWVKAMRKEGDRRLTGTQVPAPSEA